MSIVRRHFPGIDKPECDECSNRAEVVIEEYPNRQEHRHLCRDCAITALQEHPSLLASAVITLILMSERPVFASGKIRQKTAI